MTKVPLHEPASADALVGQHRRRIDLIQQCANEAHRLDFDRRWLAVLIRCAQWFSTMPLNPDVYREPGGAFRFTIETAFYAMRLAGGRKFGTNLPSEERRRVEPQYNYAVFLAAVCSALDEPYRHFSIVRERDLLEWNPSVHGAAAAWLGDQPYRVNRRTATFPVERMRTGMLAQMLVGAELLAGLDAEVLGDLFGAINPSMQPVDAESLIHKVVREAISVSVDFDRKAQRQVFAPVQFSVPSAVRVAAALQPVVTPAPAASPASTPVTSRAAPSSPVAVPSNVPVHAHVPNAQHEAAAPTASQASVVVTPETTGVTKTSPHGAVSSSAGSPQTLMEALGLASDDGVAVTKPTEATPVAPGVAKESASQLGLPFPAPDSAGAAAVDPSGFLSPAPRAAPAPALDEVLKDAPNMIRELFRALREDVVSGRASVAWNAKGLVVPKRLIGGYGVASDTLVEHLRRRSLLVDNQKGDITLSPRVGELILPREAS